MSQQFTELAGESQVAVDASFVVADPGTYFDGVRMAPDVDMAHSGNTVTLDYPVEDDATVILVEEAQCTTPS